MGINDILKGAFPDPLKPKPQQGPPAPKSSAQKKVDAIVRNTSAPPVKETVKKSLNVEQSARGGKSRAQVAKETPGTWENAVQNGRKILGIKEGSDEDKALKSLLWTTINQDPNKPSHVKDVDGAEVIRVYKLMREAKKGTPSAQQEITTRIQGAREILSRPQPEPTIQPLTEDQSLNMRRSSVMDFSSGGIASQNQDASYVDDLVNNFKSNTGGGPVGEFISGLAGEILFTPLRESQRIKFASRAAGQIAQGNPDFNPMDVLGPIGEIALDVAGSMVGAPIVGSLLKRSSAIAKVLAKLNKVDPAEAKGFIATVQALQDEGVEDAYKVAKQLREAAKEGKYQDLRDAIIKSVPDSSAARLAEDLPTTNGKAQFVPKADPAYVNGETPNLVGMAEKTAPQDSGKTGMLDVYHGGPDIPDNTLRRYAGGTRSSDMGGIFVTPNKAYAENYVSPGGALYKTTIDANGMFDFKNPEHLKKLAESLVDSGEYDNVADVLADLKRSGDLEDWSIGSTYLDGIKDAGFKGAKLKERPGAISKAGSSFSVDGEPIYSYALFEDTQVTRVPPEAPKVGDGKHTTGDVTPLKETHITPSATVKPEVKVEAPKPVDAPQIKAEGLKTTGPGAQRVNKDNINKYRQALGLDMTKAGSRGWDKDIEKAVNEGYVDKAVDTAKNLKESPRPMATHEQFAAGIKIAELDDQLITAEKAVADAVESGDIEAIVKAKDARQVITDELDVVTLTLNKNGGTDVARSLASRRALINSRIENPRAYAISTLGRKLTDAEEETVKGLAKGISDAKAELNSGPARADVAKRLQTRQPRKIEKLVSKAEADYNAAKLRAAEAAKAISSKGRRGGAVNPYLFDVAYHGAKYQILKGVRALDDIIKFIKTDAPDISDEDLMNAIDTAEKDLRQPARPVTKPNLVTLRNEIKDALDSANGVEQTNYFNQLLDDLDNLAKQPAAKTSADAIELADQAATIKRKLATGQSYGRDILARGDNAIQDPALIKARGRVKREEAKLRAWANAQVEKDRRETLTAGQKAWDFVKGGIMNSRQLLTGPDTSFGLRQGATAFLQWHFKEGGKMIWNGLKSFVSEGAFEATDAFVRGMKRYDEAIGAGLDLTDFVAGKTEEDILGGWIQKKWTKGNPYRGSNRAYTAGANSIRLDLYTKMADAVESSGKTMSTEEAAALSNFINVATGRSSALSGQAGKVLNGIAFAPKYALSRIEYLTGSPLWKAMKAGKEVGDMRVATEIAKEYMKFYGSVTAIGVGLQLGADKGYWEADLDPRSTNFMKVGIRNKNGSVTWYDLTGGLGSYFVTMYRTGAAVTRFVQGSILNSKDPIKPIKNQKGEYTDNYGMAAGGFVTGKTSPLLKTFISATSDFDRKTGKTKAFGKVKGPAELASGLVTPISAQTAIEGNSKAQQLEALELFRNFAFEFFGGGNSTTDIGPSQSAIGAAAKIRKKSPSNSGK